MKKIISAAVLAAAMLAAASCGTEQETTTSAAETSAAVQEFKASDVTAAILEEVPINSAVEKGVDDLSVYFGSIDTDSVKDASYYMCASGAYPDEIAVIEFNSEELAAAGADAVKERMESQRTTYETYSPEEMYKFDGAVAEAKGSYVVYVISSDNAKAKEVIGRYIQ